MNSKLPFEIVILGCGAMAQDGYVPVLKEMMDRFRVRYCVDTSAENAQAVARALGGEPVHGGLEALQQLPRTDGAVVALPNRLHAAATIQCLESGRHTLCEKPLALTARECEEIEAAIRRSGRVLSVNLLRRLYPSTAMMKWLLQAGWLGEVREIEVWEGGLGAWQSRTGFQFNPAAAGGGVTLDRGAHVYDLLVHWFGRPEIKSYHDDACGGCEANSYAEFFWPGNGTARVRISKSEPWDSYVEIRGTKGTAIFDVARPQEIRFKKFMPAGSATPEFASLRVGPENFTPASAVAALVDGWRSAAQEGTPNPTPFEEVRESVALMELCYQRKQALTHDWLKWTYD